MPYRFLSALLVTLGAVGMSAQADTVFVRGREKPILGEVKAESAKDVSVLVKKTTETIAGVDVLDIHYDDVQPAALRIGAYKAAKDSEKESNDSPDAFKRKAALANTIAKYNETLKEMKPLHKYATRVCRYKVAILMLKQAHIEKLSTAKAITELQRYRTDYPDSWEINHVMPLIAQTQMEANDYKAASETFADMALMTTLPAEVRTNAKVMIIQVAVRAGDIKDAQKKLTALEADAAAAGDPKLASRVKMVKAEVLVGLKQNDEAVKLLTAVIKESSDKDTKALAHNTLGECLFKAQKFSEARWEFLWVDTVFNQDRVQHARALYYLGKTFQQLNDEPRAQECRTMLEGAQFSGTEWQLKAQKEAGK